MWYNDRARIVEQEEVAIARQWCSKLVSIGTNWHATIEEIVRNEVWSMPWLYNESQQEKLIRDRSEYLELWVASEQQQFVAGCEVSPLLAAETWQWLVMTE